MTGMLCFKKCIGLLIVLSLTLILTNCRLVPKDYTGIILKLYRNDKEIPGGKQCYLCWNFELYLFSTFLADKPIANKNTAQHNIKTALNDVYSRRSLAMNKILWNEVVLYG